MTVRRSPFDLVAARAATSTATKQELLQRVRAMEESALAGPGVAFAVACLQDVRFLTAATIGVYEELAQRGAQVLVLGRGVPADLAPGVEGVDLDEADPLGEEWTVLLAGRSFSCFVARDVQAPVEHDGLRLFTWAQTDAPDVVADVHEVLAGDLRARRDDIRIQPWPTSGPADGGAVPPSDGGAASSDR